MKVTAEGHGTEARIPGLKSAIRNRDPVVSLWLVFAGCGGIIAAMRIPQRPVRYAAGLALLCLALAAAAQTPPPAEQVLAGARTQAASQHKSIFLIFHASW